jgi:hypothetical protein
LNFTDLKGINPAAEVFFLPVSTTLHSYAFVSMNHCVMTQRVLRRFENVSDFPAVCKNILGCESLTKGVTSGGRRKNRVRTSCETIPLKCLQVPQVSRGKMILLILSGTILCTSCLFTYNRVVGFLLVLCRVMLYSVREA